MTIHAPCGAGSRIYVLPHATTGGATVSCSTPDTPGPFCEVDNGSNTPSQTFKITGVSIDPASSGITGCLDIAYGDVGEEQVVASVPIQIFALNTQTLALPPSGPISSGSRLSCRLCAKSAPKSLGVFLMLQTL